MFRAFLVEKTTDKFILIENIPELSPARPLTAASYVPSLVFASPLSRITPSFDAIERPLSPQR
jgi:hypothetical protein